MLSNQKVVEIGHQWLNTWNDTNLQVHENLFDENAEEISTLANRIIIESHGFIKGKQSLSYFWAIIRTKIPNYTFQLQSVSAYKNCAIVYFNIIALNTQAIAKISFNESQKINRIVISHL